MPRILSKVIYIVEKGQTSSGRATTFALVDNLFSKENFPRKNTKKNLNKCSLDGTRLVNVT